MIERLAWPVRLAPDGRLAVVEQDSDDDIQQCIRAIVATRLGDRADLPAMGTPDPSFAEQPIDVDALREQLDRHEPRAAILLTTHPDAIDAALGEIDAVWDRPGPATQPES